MQIWKEKHKDLWILFTNWGRIGGYDSGQYQNTPYGSAKQAEEEFKKIFKVFYLRNLEGIENSFGLMCYNQ